MVNNPHFSDVQFQVDSGEVLYAHMFVLYARCPQALQIVSTGTHFPPLLQESPGYPHLPSERDIIGTDGKCLCSCSCFSAWETRILTKRWKTWNVVWGGCGEAVDPSLHSAPEQRRKLPRCFLPLNFRTCASADCLVHLGVSWPSPRLGSLSME